jgi:integrase
MDQPESGGGLGGGQDAGARTRKRKVTDGVTPIKRTTKEVYQVAFSFRGVQCREVIDMPHSKANKTYCLRLRAEILGKIERNDFRYVDYFPESPRAVLFGHRPAKTQPLKVALEAYRDRVAKTLEASTSASYRRAIDNVLVPWCGDMTIAAFKPSDIRDWVGKQNVTLKRIRNVMLPLRAVLD